jgi:hypothetical protein
VQSHHLLIKDTGSNVIAESMQLIAGRTAQEYNQRKGKQGWKEKRDRLSFHRHVNSLYPRSAWCREFHKLKHVQFVQAVQSLRSVQVV